MLKEKEDLLYDVARAKATLEFMESSFYKTWLKPHLENGRQSLERSLGQIAISSVLNGSAADQLLVSMSSNVGKLLGINSIIQDLEGWISEGEESAKKLKKDEVNL